MALSKLRLLPLLELTRVEVVAASIGNAWLMAQLAWAIESAEARNPQLDALGRPAALGLTALVAGGLAVGGLALNDVLDARHDRAFAPGRPIPAGRVHPRTAVGLGVGALLAAIGASLGLGTTSAVLTVVAAFGALFYNLIGRFMPAVGIVTLGLLWALMMAIPNPGLTFGWPIVLVLTHVVALAGAHHVLGGKRPRLGPGDTVGIVAGWVFWTLVIVAISRARESVAGPLRLDAAGAGLWAAPLVAVAVFAGVLAWRLRRRGPRRATAEAVARLAVRWMLVYDAAWLVGVGHPAEATLPLGLLAASLAGGLWTRWRAAVSAGTLRLRE